LDHFADLRVRNELTADRNHFEAETTLAVGTQPIPVGILLVEPDLVEQVVGLLQIERPPFLVPFGAPAIDGVGRGSYRSRRSDAEPEGLVQLVTVDAECERMAEILVPEQFRDLGITLIRVADVDRRVRSV